LSDYAKEPGDVGGATVTVLPFPLRTPGFSYSFTVAFAGT